MPALDTSSAKGHEMQKQQQRPFRTIERENHFKYPSTSSFPYPRLQKLVDPHVQSFDALFDSDGILERAIKDLPPRVAWDTKVADGERGNRIQMKIEDVTVAKPMFGDRERNVADPRIYPFEARERLSTYAGRMTAKISYSINGDTPQTHTLELGQLPIMVKSSRCNIKGLSPAQLVEKYEEQEEMGGYFIINGNEKVIRLLVVPRQNYTMGIVRDSLENRGAFYTKFGVQIRCVRPDKSSQTNTLHYLSNGGSTLRFSWRKNEYMVPVILIMKALVDVSDQDIFLALAQGDFKNTFLTDRIELLLRGAKIYKLHSSSQCREYLGSKFRVVLQCPEDWSNEQVGLFLLDRIVLVHLKNNEDKFRMLISMLRKLYALTAGECSPDNPDSPANHEVLLPGFLYGMILKEKLDEVLLNCRAQINQDVQRGVNVDFFNQTYMSKLFQKTNTDVGNRLRAFLATGNLVSPSGLDLQQASGYTIVAEKLNFYRYISHFRCIHRGAFFAELKTTTVRKLLPEAWGFLCPVHTPDGAPCGLLNHLAHECKIVVKQPDVSHIPGLLSNFGMTPAFDLNLSKNNHVVVQLDGKVIGWALPHQAQEMAHALRVFKTTGKHNVPLDLEIGHVPLRTSGQYPGLYLFSDTSRMVRPVKYLFNKETDMVGSFEQVYMDIAISKDEIIKGKSTHVEFSPTQVLSVLANMTPFSDFNQSPRNMYQCQMGKQTMGTPSTALTRRTDNKLYRLHTGQTPIVRPKLHNEYGMDGFPQGTNAIVAVISYTGYDMEDAMILNKSSHERGFGNGAVYKSHITDLTTGRYKGGVFGIGRDVSFQDQRRKNIDLDGLPFVGAMLKTGDPICAFEDPSSGLTKFEKYKGDEDCIVDQVRLLGSNNGEQPLNKIHIKLRIPRAPVIGDKFSSRHGQKGVCSQKYPAVDMPFSESGMQPDVIINPHAFPSRMTIGMLIEMMGGKAGAMHGIEQDSTPFTFSESDTPAEYFGEQLLKAGYNYHGNEAMYSGITGQEFKADIFLGTCYYQRLRHMVSDKWQVRTTGPIDSVTRQPVKGRKRGGGVRFGEMERDALLAHGTSFLLQDRLLNCSDYSTAWVCKVCGSLTGIGYEDVGMGSDIKPGPSPLPSDLGPSGEFCRVCRAKEEQRLRQEEEELSSQGKTRPTQEIIKSSARKDNKVGPTLVAVAMPFVFRYLVAELAAMGISLKVMVNS